METNAEHQPPAVSRSFLRRRPIVSVFIGILIVVLIYLSLPIPMDGGPLLQKYPLEKGDAIVALKIMFKHPISEGIGDFYVDDPVALQRLKSEWVTGPPAPSFACGYNYKIYVVSKGEVQGAFSLNLKSGCNTIVNEKGEARWFSPSLIEQFKNIYKKPQIEYKTFDNLTSARDYFAATKTDPHVLMTLQPKWTRFDGTLAFSYSCDHSKEEGEYDHSKEEGKYKNCLASVSNQLRAKYPEEDLKLEFRGQTYNHERVLSIEVELQCKDSFRKGFNLFPIKKDGWKPYEPVLGVVFKI